MRNLAVFALLLALGTSQAGAQTIGGPVSGGGGGSGPPSGAAGGILGGTYPNPTIADVSTLSPVTSGTLNNYVIGGVIPLAGTFTALTATGAVSLSPASSNVTLSPTGTGVVTISPVISTASTTPVNLSPTIAYTGTGNGISAISESVTMTPGGATAGTMAAHAIFNTIGTSSVNISLARAVTIQLAPSAGYSGTIASGFALGISPPGVAGTNPITVYRGVQIGATTNGNAITTGTVTNHGLEVLAATAAAGVGGTVSNNGIIVTVPSGSSAGNTDKGIYITGNGGAASTKYALFSDSTAPSQLAGVLAITNATDAASSTGGALQVSGGASVAKRLWIPAISASAGLQTAVLCQSSGGEMIADSVACLASSARFKIIHGPMPYGALDKIAALPIERWSYKAEGIFKEGDWTRERIGAIAEDVASLDPRLVGYDGEGKPRSISTEQLLALTIKAVQELKTANDNLRAEVHRLEAGIR